MDPMLDTSMLEPERTRPLKRTEYDRLVELGMFDGEPIELLHGTLVTMSPNYPEHTGPIGQLNTILVPRLLGRALVRVQMPVWAADESEPEPDVAVVPPGDYFKTHPDRVFLIIEVASSSLKKDRDVKAPLYAASGFPEYWLFDVASRQVHVFRDPVEGTYRTVTQHGRAEVLRCLAFPDVDVPVAEIMPPR
jgi:Uma2 family endonuclease